MAGGTAFYFSNAVSRLDLRYKLITALAPADMPSVYDLQAKGIDTTVLPSSHTVYFENIYTGSQDHRTQRVVRQADPFTAAQFRDVDAAVFHLGPLLAGDIPVDLIRTLAAKGKVSLDAQGYLREVKNQNVLAIDWSDKIEALQHIHTLKVNEYEMAVLTGQEDVQASARTLAAWGVKEVVITLGSMGSVIYDGQNFHNIPAYMPGTAVVDATGCGDTYMAGYLYKRIKQAPIQEAGEFAAAMATLKIEGSGPFTGTKEDVLHLLASRKAIVYP
jgi:sugar/nucleoside kinase (ribokinase family)